MHEHPPIDSLARFARGLLPPHEMATVAIHVARCDTCRTAATRPSLHPSGEPSTYGEAIRRVALRTGRRAERYARDRRRALGALDRILALPTEDWNRAIRSSPKYHSYAFAQHALRACKESWSDDPHRSEHLAELALEVANRLSGADHGRRALNDLRSTAWTYVANCRRIRGRFLQAPSAFEAAVEHHQAGSATAPDRVCLLSYLSSLSLDTRNLETALELEAEILETAADIGDQHLLGRNQIKHGLLLRTLGRHDEAIATARHSLTLISEAREPGIGFLGGQNLAYALNVAGDTRGALAVLGSLSRRSKVLKDRLRRARFRWTEGAILKQAGDLEAARESLRASRAIFENADIPSDVALLDLDLAQIALALGETEIARGHAREAFPSLALNGIPNEALDAVELFRQAGGID